MDIVTWQAALVFMCVWLCMCEPEGLAISLADSGHLAEGFWDRHCLLSTITLIFMPRLRCPCHSPESPITRNRHSEMDEKRQTWHGWDLRQKAREQLYKNHCCQLAKPSRHISSFYWARIQINILLLTKLARFDVCGCSCLWLITHLQVLKCGCCSSGCWCEE